MSVIEKIVEIPVTYFVPLLDCGCAGELSTFRGVLEVGQEQRCLTCEERGGEMKTEELDARAAQLENDIDAAMKRGVPSYQTRWMRDEVRRLDALQERSGDEKE